MAHCPAECMQEPEGSHHETPEDAPQCTIKWDFAPIGPSVPQPLRVLTLQGSANTAPPGGWPQWGNAVYPDFDRPEGGGGRWPSNLEQVFLVPEVVSTNLPEVLALWVYNIRSLPLAGI